MSQDLYEVLEIPRTATDEEIKKAYRRLYMKYHPDKNTTEEAKKKSQLISNAKDILLDSQKRKIYDARGFKGLEEAEQQPNMFQQNRQLPVRQCKVQVDLDAFYSGKLIQFALMLQRGCTPCNSTGCSDNSKKIACHQCKGQGQVVYQQRIGPMVHNQRMECNMCNGRGSSFSSQYMCRSCNGIGSTRQQTKVEYFVKKGSNYGPVLLEHKGDFVDEKTNGHIQLILEKPPISQYPFQRRGNNLYLEKTITLKEALLGFHLSFDHILPEKTFSIKSTQIVKHGDVYELQGLGMPKRDNVEEFGSMKIKFFVKFPLVITAEMKTALSLVLPDHPRETPSDEHESFSLVDVPLAEEDDEKVEENEQHEQGQPQVHFAQAPGVQCAQQ